VVEKRLVEVASEVVASVPVKACRVVEPLRTVFVE
jgi:hypothetical protein